MSQFVFTLSDPAVNFAAVTPTDNAFFVPGSTLASLTRALYVGVSGDLAVIRQDGTAVTFKNAAVGYHPIRCVGVMATGTVASSIVRLW